MKNDVKRSRVYENKLQNLLVKPEIMMALASQTKQPSAEQLKKLDDDKRKSREKKMKRATIVMNDFNLESS